ncbi:hypothetical protein ACE6H2_019732 [Prunus campanulata]
MKLKKNLSLVSVEPKAADSEWWDNSSLSNDEEKGFKYFFRVSKKTFDYICSLVREDLVSRPPSGLINIEGRLLSVEKQVAIALRRLAPGESQVSVGAALGVGQSSVSQVTWRFIEALEEPFGFPNCCGAIAGTYIIMTLPTIQTSDDCCDLEDNHSMLLLQGIVDHEMRFLDIVTGWPGGMMVSKLLKCSRFFKLCEGGQPSISAFNAAHGAARSLAVTAFSQLKGTWRILNKVMWRPNKWKLPSIILICCLLHNIRIDSGDILQPDVALSGHHDSGYGEQCCRDILVKHLLHSKQTAAPK